LAEKLKPDGILVLRMPNLLYMDQGLSEYFDVEHLSHFSYFTLASLLRRYGFHSILPHYEYGERDVFVSAWRSGNWGEMPRFDFCDNRISIKYLIKGYEVHRQCFIKEKKTLLLETLESWRRAGKKIGFYGTGKYARQIFDLFDVRPFFCCAFDSDSAKQGGSFLGFPVRKPSELDTEKIEALFITSQAFVDEIRSTITASTSREIELLHL